MTRILLADDDDANRLTLSVLLEDEGFHVDVAASFAEAGRMLEEDAYDAVMLDQHLGDGLGTDLIPRIRARHPRTRVLLLSGSVSAANVPVGADASLAKGADFASILEAIGLPSAG